MGTAFESRRTLTALAQVPAGKIDTWMAVP